MIRKRYVTLVMFSLGCLFFVGCSTKTLTVEPRVKYGNPSQKHVKDIPQLQYREVSASAENKARPKIGADEYEALADAMLSNGKYLMAFMQYENALKKNRANLRVEYKKGIALLGGNKKDEAEKQFLMIIKEKPDFVPAHEGLGLVNFKRRLYPASKRNFETAIALDPLLWRSYHYLGNIYDRQKKFDLAVKEYKTALTIKPEAGFIYNNLGVSLYKSGRYKDAVDAYGQALKSNYANKKTYNNLGQALVKLNLYDNAFDAFNKGGSKAAAYNNIGVGYLNSGRIEKAAECFKKAIELSPRFYVLANENLKKCRLKQK